MLPRPQQLTVESNWRRVMAEAITDPMDLISLLDLPANLLPEARAAAEKFPLRVPLPFLMRMKKGDPEDPLLRQVLPLGIELEATPGFTTDPVGDANAMLRPGLLQKYHGRVLLVATGACAIHCRYCFRRHYPYAEAHAGMRDRQELLETIRDNPQISEVILSGGDPLSLSDEKLAVMIADLGRLPQVKRLRIHTRLPVTIPSRITADLVALLSTSHLAKTVVLHINHAREIDSEVRTMCQSLRAAGCFLLNQSVLLRGVNDDAAVLSDLSEALFDAGVLPYYLHQLDRVSGASHFLVDDATARALHQRLTGVLPGYLVPRLVREQAGMPSKTAL